MRKNIILYLFLFSEATLIAQNTVHYNIDSLKSLLPTDKAVVYNKIGHYYRNEKKDYDTALQYYNEGLSVAKRTNNELLEMQINFNIGCIYLYNKDGESKGVINFNDAANIALKLKDTAVLEMTYNNIALYHGVFGNPNLHIKYNKMSLDLVKGKKGRSRIISASNMGYFFQKQNQLDSALFYYKLSLEYAKDVPNEKYLPIINLIEVSILTNDTIQGKYYVDMLLKDNINDIQNISYRLEVNLHIAQFYSAIRDFKEALIYVNNIIKLNFEDVELGEDEIKYYKTIAEVLFANKEYVKAAYYGNKYIQINEKLQKESEPKAKQIQKLQNEYDAAQDQNKKNLKIFAFILSILLLLALFLSFRLYLLNKKRAKLNEELTIANSTKDKIISVLGHDLRSPIAELVNNLSMLDDELLDENQFRGKIPLLRDKVNNVYHITDNLLHWALAQTKGLRIQTTSFSLRNIADEKILLLNTTAESKKINMINNIDTNIFINADRNHIDIILQNLLHNAIKFCKENGTITINAHNDENEVVFSIIDEGLGMKQDEIDSFLNNNQPPSSQIGTGGEKGTGIGLLLCKDLLFFNKGKMNIRTNFPQGTVFSCYVPK